MPNSSDSVVYNLFTTYRGGNVFKMAYAGHFASVGELKQTVNLLTAYGANEKRDAYVVGFRVPEIVNGTVQVLTIQKVSRSGELSEDEGSRQIFLEQPEKGTVEYEELEIGELKRFLKRLVDPDLPDALV